MIRIRVEPFCPDDEDPDKHWIAVSYMMACYGSTPEEARQKVRVALRRRAKEMLATADEDERLSFEEKVGGS